MKILFLTHRIPFPQNGGYSIVVGNTIRGLVNAGYEVSLYSLNDQKHNGRITAPDDLLNKITHHFHNIDTSISVVDATIKLITRRSANIDRFYNAGFERMLIREIITGNYDIIQFEGLFVCPYLENVRKNTSARLIYRAHNIEHQVWQRLSMQKNDPIKRVFLKIAAARIKKYELQLAGFSGVIVFTEQDKSTIQHYGSKTAIKVIPVGIAVDEYKPEPQKTDFPTLFFLGSLSWMPNSEGIKWFLENFHKELANGELPVRFYLAGDNIPEQFDEYEAMGKIFIQGEVDNALEFINSKAIMIVPLLSGGGMRVKIVEGMAMQKCIIATSLAAEGLQAQNGRNILIAETRDEFLRAIKQCIADEDYCRHIGLNARHTVELQHDIRTITRRLTAFYQQVTAASVH